MPKSKRLGILTETERERLINYDSIAVIERKNLNFRLKKKLSIIKDALEDIYLMLNSLPEDTTKDYIDTETAMRSLKATERIFKLLDLFPIEKNPPMGKLLARRYNLLKFPDSNGMVDFGYKPSPEEEELWKAVQDHTEYLKSIYDVNNVDLKLYTLQEYKEKMQPKIDSLQLSGIKYACFTNPGMIPMGVPSERAEELGYVGGDTKNVGLFLNGDYHGLARKLVAEMKEREKKQQEEESK